MSSSLDSLAARKAGDSMVPGVILYRVSLYSAPASVRGRREVSATPRMSKYLSSSFGGLANAMECWVRHSTLRVIAVIVRMFNF